MTKKRGQVQINHTDAWVETGEETAPPTPRPQGLPPVAREQGGVEDAPTAEEVNEAIQQIFRDEVAPEPEPVTMIELTPPELLERVIEQMVSEARVQDVAGREAAAAQYERDKETWNRVFFVIKRLRPLMDASPALKDSKLGALLGKLPK